jgi:hypothetical protein
MWLLHLLPSSFLLWIINILLVVGISGILLGFFIKFIPLVNQYRLPIQIASILIFCLGLYWKGGYSVEQDWRQKVDELQAKVDDSEKVSIKINTVIKKVYVDRVKVIKQDRVVIQDRIVEIAKEIDKECKVPQSAIAILNDAAKSSKATVIVGPLGKDEKQ